MAAVSICVPVYNGEKYLEQCLDCILNQSFSDLEVVVIDDHSDDMSFEIAKKYKTIDYRVRVFRNERNLGLARNWNRCVELSHGEWIKFVFQDDVIELNCLEKMMNMATLERGLVVCRRRIVFDNVSHMIKKTFYPYTRQLSIDTVFQGRFDVGPEDFCNAVLDNLGYNFVGEPTAVMVHRNIFDKVGRFNREFIQLCDLEFFSRVGCNFGIRYIPETLATFRIHPKAMSMVNKDKQKLGMERDLLLLYHEFAYNPIFQQMRNIALHRRPAIDLKRLLAFESLRAQAIAKSIRRKYVAPSSSPIDEFNRFLEDLPRIDNMPTDKWLMLLNPFIRNRRIFMLLYRYVLGNIAP
jgi:glycosyltransferase involved in cell wall biosynthesis